MLNNSSQHSGHLPNNTKAELELLHAILNQDSIYPWNPYAPEVDLYLNQLEADWEAIGASHADAAESWRAASSQMTRIWSEFTPDQAISLTQILENQFGQRMPQALLQRIATTAESVVNSQVSLLDQLVHCVQSVVTEWDISDLQVMARPLAFAMRDGHGEILEVALRSVRTAEWTELSELEQVRLSLAIARVAIDEAAEQNLG